MIRHIVKRYSIDFIAIFRPSVTTGTKIKVRKIGVINLVKNVV